MNVDEYGSCTTTMLVYSECKSIGEVSLSDTAYGTTTMLVYTGSECKPISEVSPLSEDHQRGGRFFLTLRFLTVERFRKVAPLFRNRSTVRNLRVKKTGRPSGAALSLLNSDISLIDLHSLPVYTNVVVVQDQYSFTFINFPWPVLCKLPVIYLFHNHRHLGMHTSFLTTIMLIFQHTHILETEDVLIKSKGKCRCGRHLR
jgi:hypothetical protein